MRADEIMTPKVCVVTPDTPLKEVAVFLVHRGVGAVPVVDEDGRLLGMITEADLIAVESTPDPRRHLRRDLPIDDRVPLTAGEAMTSPVVAARTDTDVADIIQTMLSEHITRMPILDQDQRLVGLVSRSDLLRPLARPDAEIAADVRDVLARWDGGLRPTVEVTEGEVTLVVAGLPEPETALRLVRAVPGVLAARLNPGEDDQPG